LKNQGAEYSTPLGAANGRRPISVASRQVTALAAHEAEDPAGMSLQPRESARISPFKAARGHDDKRGAWAKV
jgi:hypothetical protein